LRKFRIVSILGPGLISAVSGLEITNIGVFTYVGAIYGFKILWIIVLASIIIALLQQLAVEVGVVMREGVIVKSRKIFGKHLTFTILISLFIANVVTIAINIIGVSFTLNVVSGIPWYLVAISFSLLLFGLALRKEYMYLERILTLLSFVLSTYIVLMVFHLISSPSTVIELLANLIIPPEVAIGRQYFIDVLAVFGAAAAPYALIFQTSSIIMKGLKMHEIPEEFIDISVGLVFTSLASVSVAVVAAAYAPENTSTIHDMILALKPLGIIGPLLFCVGILASSTLAIEAIILCNAYMFYEYSTETTSLKDIVASKLYFKVASLTILISLLIAFAHAFSRNIFGGGFADLVRDSSILISLTSWVPALFVVLLYWKVKPLASSFIKVVSALIVGSLIVVNVVGVLGALGLS